MRRRRRRAPPSRRSISPTSRRASRRRSPAASRCCSRCTASRARTIAAIGIDTALEQLDPANRDERARVPVARRGFEAVLIDNRLDLSGRLVVPRVDRREAVGLRLRSRGRDRRSRAAHRADDRDHGNCRSAIRAAATIFRELDLTLEPGRVYRLTGANGAGKTTLFRLLAGVLAPVGRHDRRSTAHPMRRGARGNRIFALAAQNPDHQWCGATLAEDLARRRRALARYPEIAFPDRRGAGRARRPSRRPLARPAPL